MSVRTGLAVGLGCLLLAAVVLAALPTTARSDDAASQRAPDIVSEVHGIESFDGTTLAAVLWHNNSVAHLARPVILAAHGWGGAKPDLEPSARWLADLGYIVLAWDARGFGASAGTVGLNGPDEWADVSAIIDWLAARAGDTPRIQLDAPGNPRIGMVGSSYGGAIQLLAAAHDERIDAIVPDITWNDLAQSLAPVGVIKRGWVDLLYWSGTAASHGLTTGNPNTGGMDERLTEWYLEAWATGRLPESAVAPLRERSPATHNADVRAHALITQGWKDTLFWPDDAARNHAVLTERDDRETHLLFHRAGHGNSLDDADRDTVRGFIVQFFARHLLDADTDALPPVIYHEATTGNWTETDSWPPPRTQYEGHAVRSADGTTRIELVQLPLATSHTELQQFAGMIPLPHVDLAPGATSVLLETGVQGPITMTGRPVVHLDVTPGVDDATLFLSLVEATSASSMGNVLYNQVTPLRIEHANGEEVALQVELASLAHTIPAGKQLYVRVATSDLGYLGAREPGLITLHVEDARLDLPLPTPAGIAVAPFVPATMEETPAPFAAILVALAALGMFAGKHRATPRRRT